MEWTKEKIHTIVENQRKYFNTNETLDIKYRINKLKILKKALLDNQNKIMDALSKDLGRSSFEAYLTDIGPTIIEINETIKGLRKWSKPEQHYSGLLNFPSIKTCVYKLPYGVTLIISPFNFPILLTFGPLIAAIAGGNTAVIKTSSKSSNCTNVMQEIIKEYFDERYITLIDGGHDIADYCLEERFDKIFYTGSPNVAKHVMEYASKNLTPVALELGGETGNYAIIRKDADLKDAARKIAFFKILNSGQICININQVAVAEEVADSFVNILKDEIIRQIGDHPLYNEEYPHLIGKKAFEWCSQLVEERKDRIIIGGHGDTSSLKYEPTILYPIDINDEIVNKELFCPILPVIKFKDNEVDKLLDTISSREKGLAFYLFTKDIKWAKKVMQSQQYGGGCVNEVCVHMMVKGVPFNGVGHSGMGAYHGIWGFKEFTHPQTVLYGKTKFNLPLREHPYSTKKEKIIKKFMR